MTERRYLVAGPIRLDRADERLRLSGKPVRLGGKAFALLKMLMERPRTLVTKVELFDAVWPGLAVSDAVLTTAVKEIRQAIGDNARSPRFVETVHGRGYRFILAVEEEDEPVNGPRGEAARWTPKRLRLVAGGILLAAAIVAGTFGLFTRDSGQPSAAAALVAHPKSIAVLPFEDLSESRDQQWFAAGLTEEILSSLARTPDLHVAARTSTLSIAPDDAREIGRRLNVSHILEGSVRREGDRVRVTAQLIRASDGFHLWSQNYDRAAADVVSIQEDIAVAIARALNTVMSPEQLEAMVDLGTRSVEAYEEYLRGLAFDRKGLITGSDDDFRRSFEAWERARTIDPGFAAAQWEAAQAWFGNTTRVGSSITEARGSEEERLRQYLLRVDAAIASSHGRPEQLKFRSARALMDVRLRDALNLMRSYLEARPRDTDTWEELVDLAAYAGERRLMAHAAERIHTLSLESGFPRSRAITASVLSLDIDNAVRRAREQLARRPGEALIQYQAHRALLWGGHRDEARRVLRALLSSSLPAENKALAELRQACADGGAGASAIVARMQRLPDASTSGAWHIAQLTGDQRAAIEVLRPLDRPERITTLMQYLVYPMFDARPFPLLQARLDAERIRRPAPIAIPFACPRNGSVRV